MAEPEPSSPSTSRQNFESSSTRKRRASRFFSRCCLNSLEALVCCKKSPSFMSGSPRVPPLRTSQAIQPQTGRMTSKLGIQQVDCECQGLRRAQNVERGDQLALFATE